MKLSPFYHAGTLPTLLFLLLLLLVVATTMRSTEALLITKEPVSQLLKTHANSIEQLKSICAAKVGQDASSLPEPYSNDVFFLRYCLASKEEEDLKEQKTRLERNLNWRLNEGKKICQAATQALELAQCNENSWDNNPVLNAAPHSSIISEYLTPSNVITTVSSNNDLVYCIRAGQIDDNSLMKQVSVDLMVEFFIYAKEVNAQVANQRSLQTDVLQCIVTANDLAGVKLVGGSGDFRKALSESSTKANDLYPATNGPTLLLNLPGLLNALVKLFTPLFPAEVKARLKFVQGPLKDVSDLKQVATSATGSERTAFLKQLDDTIYT